MHKEQGEEYVIETKAKWKYRGRSNLYPGGDVGGMQGTRRLTGKSDVAGERGALGGQW